MPGEIYGDILSASGNPCTVDNKSEFAALVAKLRYRRLQVEEDIVESSGELDTANADRIFTTAGKKKYRSYSAGPDQLRFVSIGNGNPQTAASASSPVIRRPQRTQDVKVPTLNLGNLHTSQDGRRSVASITSDVAMRDQSSEEVKVPNLHLENLHIPEDGPSSVNSVMSDIPLRDQQDSKIHLPEGGSPNNAPLAYEWPVEDAKFMYGAHSTRDYRPPSSGGFSDNQENWKISSNSILSAPPPITAAFEAAESFFNLAAASFGSLSENSRTFFDRSAVNLKGAAVRSSASWQQAVSKVTHAMQTAKAMVETPRPGHEDEEVQGEERADRQSVQFWKRTAVLGASMRSGFADAVQQAKDILQQL